MNCVSSANLWSQGELFGVVVETNDQTATLTSPCPQCGSTVATVGSGSGPHWGVLRCVRGHYLKWLPRPIGGLQ